MNNLNKKELSDLQAYGYELSDERPNGLMVDSIIVVSHGRKELHYPDYPFIKIFGAVGKKLVDLGWYNHYVAWVPTNTNSLGKNIFRVMPWVDKQSWKVSEHFISDGSFQIGNYWKDDKELVILQ